LHITYPLPVWKGCGELVMPYCSSRITDALVKANNHLKLSSAIDDMDAYIELTDDVFQKILWSDESIKEVGSVLI